MLTKSPEIKELLKDVILNPDQDSVPMGKDFFLVRVNSGLFLEKQEQGKVLHRERIDGIECAVCM